MCTEYVSGGNLIDFLRARQDSLCTPDFLKIAHSGVSGLIYLSEHKIVHRGFYKKPFFFFFLICKILDIAARNFLITNQENRFILVK